MVKIVVRLGQGDHNIVLRSSKHQEVAHYIRKVGDDSMVEVWLRHEYSPKEQLSRWPMAFKEQRVAFLEYAKEDDVWT